MAENFNLKELLIDFLMEQYKQEVLVTELDMKGIYLSKLLVQNLEIVLDVIGFPRDNSEEYDCRHEAFGEPRDESKKLIDDDYFPDDWLKDHYYSLTQDLSEEKNIVVTEEGVDVSKVDNLHKVREKMSEYIDWLHIEFEKYKRGEKPWQEYLGPDDVLGDMEEEE